ncbi:BLUF domain-containing protein [Methylolobus aquaticus]|uniref:BLUF domain-containing protein n=1 Tax=Methylotetracoccus oryzae TaxID=1919059 RepID=UPI0010206C98|nr:BLUF domain-containing protein [Methylotetracoccus oryzae]RYU56794.1 BLUF domain-containing protein [Methylolobus aquaticus]
MKTLLRLIYTSRSNVHLDEAGLASLLEQSRGNNYDSGITGVLSFGHGFFLQVLEGPERELISLYSRIIADSRHRDCEILDVSLTHDRLFPNWTMGFVGAFKRGSAPYNELLDYRIVRDDAAKTRALLDDLLEIVTE